MSLHLVLGGARSGKSAYAARIAHNSGLHVSVIVTAEALDEEMAERILHHQRERPADWQTVEAPFRLADALSRTAAANRCVIVDCMTLWLSNLLLSPDNPAAPVDLQPVAEQQQLFRQLPALPGEILFVSNEVGLGLVPETPLGRQFRDDAGRLNQQLAHICERVTFVAAGLPLTLKG